MSLSRKFVSRAFGRNPVVDLDTNSDGLNVALFLLVKPISNALLSRRQFGNGLLAWSLVALSIGRSTEVAAHEACSSIFPKSKTPESIVDLFALRDQEIANLSRSTIRWMNGETRKALENEVPPESQTQARMIDEGRLRKLLDITRDHVVVSSEFTHKYSPENIDIGYCFGRAMYVHLMLRKLGIQEKSIRKIWAVGPMRSLSGSVIWGFHVATAVYTPNGWMTVDPLTLKPEPLRHWFSRFEGQSTDGRVRFYATEAAKFGPTLGKYSRAQLGLDLKREEDWYRHFFPDMLETVRGADLEALGLMKVPPGQQPVPEGANETVWETWRRLFGI